MSYEGYTQRLCSRGHLTIEDAYPEFELKYCRVKDCGCSFVWEHAVDQTNDNGFKVYLTVKSFAEYKECPHCGNRELVNERVYEIPTAEEVERQRKVYEENNNQQTGSAEDSVES